MRTDPIRELLRKLFPNHRVPVRDDAGSASRAAPTGHGIRLGLVAGRVRPRGCWGYLMGAAREYIIPLRHPHYVQLTEVYVEGATLEEMAELYVEYEQMRARQEMPCGDSGVA